MREKTISQFLKTSKIHLCDHLLRFRKQLSRFKERCEINPTTNRWYLHKNPINYHPTRDTTIHHLRCTVAWDRMLSLIRTVDEEWAPQSSWCCWRPEEKNAKVARLSAHPRHQAALAFRYRWPTGQMTNGIVRSICLM